MMGNDQRFEAVSGRADGEARVGQNYGERHPRVLIIIDDEDHRCWAATLSRQLVALVKTGKKAKNAKKKR